MPTFTSAAVEICIIFINYSKYVLTLKIPKQFGNLLCRLYTSMSILFGYASAKNQASILKKLMDWN